MSDKLQFVADVLEVSFDRATTNSSLSDTKIAGQESSGARWNSRTGLKRSERTLRPAVLGENF
jgi:hypothetical protein